MIDVTKLPATAAEAQRLGKRYYFTGRPCRRGHVAERYVGNQMCMGCKRMTYATGPSTAWNVVHPPSGIPFPADTPQQMMTPELVSEVWGEMLRLSYGVITKSLNKRGFFLPAQLRPHLTAAAPQSYDDLIAKGITEYEMANNGWIVDRQLNDNCPHKQMGGYLGAIAAGHAIHADFVKKGWLS